MPETRTSKIIDAPPRKLWLAFMRADALVAWLPPAPMTGRLHAFDGRVGGGYRMSLFYPEGDRTHRGKTNEREDRVRVRFLELVPLRRIVQAVIFETDDPAFHGEMRMVVTFALAAGGTKVTIHCADLPRGLRPKDNDAGTRLSLEQLARWAGSTSA